MEDTRWFRLITVGLVLAALAVGYFLLSGSFIKSKPKTENSAVFNATPAPTPKPSVLGVNNQPSTPSAYTRIVNRAQGEVQKLPNTGFPIGLAAVFAFSAIISGWGLRKFPH